MTDLILQPAAEDFPRLLMENKVVLADFWAQWCGPCKMLAPVIDELAEKFEGKVQFVKIDVDIERELAEKYGVQSIPTVLFFKDGTETAREIGFQPESVYSDILTQLCED